MHHAARPRAAGATLPVLCAGLLLAVSAAAGASTPKPLRAGGWTASDRPTIASGNVLDPSLCDSTSRLYPLMLTTGGPRLRVAIDTPMRSNTFEFQVIDPSGHDHGIATNDNTFDAEVFVDQARRRQPGSIRVMPQGVDRRVLPHARRSSRRPSHDAEAAQSTLLPDLRRTRRWRSRFVAPLNSANGLYPPDTVNPPLDVAGVHPFVHGRRDGRR